jgi:tRNA threonylcarbamoyladenosine biosynthesis protein TsaE
VSCVDSHSAEETRRIGTGLGQELRGGDVLGISGELGSGKTCLVQGIARGLEVDPAIPITSPTFTLVGEYPGRVALRHADFFRVESYARLEDAGFDDLCPRSGSRFGSRSFPNPSDGCAWKGKGCERAS